MILYILLIGHLIADFFSQTSKTASLKNKKFRYILFHSLIYSGIFQILCFCFIKPLYAIIASTIILLSHFVIDSIRCEIDKKLSNPKHLFISFVIDQVVHIGIIISICHLFNLNEYTTCLYKFCSIKIDNPDIVLYSLLFVALMNPTAVFVKKLLSVLFGSPANDNIDSNSVSDNHSNNQNVGYLIGILERLITAILLLCNQYAAIGLVLTAKSIARFKQLEERDFAEKYLVGTLTSLSVSLILTLFIMTLI